MLIFQQSTTKGKAEAIIRARGKTIKVVVLKVDGQVVKLGYEADPDVEINRLAIDQSKHPDGQSLSWRQRIWNWLHTPIPYMIRSLISSSLRRRRVC